MKWQSGMTIVELMVSLAITLLVVVAATAGYIKIITTYKSQSAISANFMSNLTGFDLMRYDIEMAGYGLPSAISGFTYTEAAAQSSYSGYTPQYDPSSLNEASLGNANGPPHALVLGGGATGSTLSGNTPAVLAIKSSVASINNSSGHFGVISTALETSATDLVTGDHYIAIDSSGALQQGGAPGVWDNTFNSASPPGALGSGLVGFLYGLGPSQTNTMPFNRVDYYLDNYNLPSYCAPGTFELYRGTVSQTKVSSTQGGLLVAPPSPMIDCVEDFQVAFGVDTSGAGIVWQPDLGTENTNYGHGGSSSILMLPSDQQKYLREVKVFVIYQEGRGNVGKTPGFGFSGSLSIGDLKTSFPAGVHTFTPGAQYTQYRWRVKEIDMKPMNLHSNW
ncbi:MAG: prepilin-type N-terminal cleavage/methylation domain-containing protein [Syntrophobacteraceae bacterium]|nr:prepilin-type N-terminal cleavage/methylation domain-containing protein [Syntrophobacteraceae bacterium]